MGLIADNKGNFELTPTGTFVARCIKVIDLGTQHSEKFNKNQRKVMVAWELPTEPMTDGRPFGVAKRYTISLTDKASLRKDLEAWRGRPFTKEELEGFDLKNILDKTCYLNITHTERDGNIYANIAAVMALPKGLNCPDRINDLVHFDIDNYDAEVYTALSEGLRKIIDQSLEVKGGVTPAKPAVTKAAEEEDVPF